VQAVLHYIVLRWGAAWWLAVAAVAIVVGVPVGAVHVAGVQLVGCLAPGAQLAYKAGGLGAVCGALQGVCGVGHGGVPSRGPSWVPGRAYIVAAQTFAARQI
jgi:hypothetical protein